MQECIFCKIVNREIPADVVYEDEEVLAFRDINPQAPVHVLVIPKAHHSDLAAAVRADAGLVARTLAALTGIAKDLGLEETGHRVVVNTGEDGYQTVQHLHFHLLGKRRLAWPPG
ncbi:MAG: histidine triad nucleotide-binding protein [Christensenellales bacterium]